MTVLTCLEIAGNYPKNLLIKAAQDKETEKWAGFLYLLRDGQIHKLMLNSDFKYDSEEQANTMIGEYVDVARNYVEGMEMCSKKEKENY